MLSFFPRGVLDETLNLIESVSEGFPSYSSAGALYNLDDSSARVYCACSRCGYRLFGLFLLLSFFSLLFLPLFGRRLIKTEILSQRAVKPQTTNQPNSFHLQTPQLPPRLLRQTGNDIHGYYFSNLGIGRSR